MYKLILILLLSSNSYSQTHPPINWNDKELKWHSYEEGIEKIKSTGKPGMLIIYADWCPTCKEYSTLFSNKPVVQNLEGLILIRTNKDTSPSVSKNYSFDGEYVPRTFALNSKGKIITKFYSDKAKYTYFIPSGSPEFLIEFSKLIKKFGE